MGVADLVILIKWFLVGAAVLFVLGGLLMIYLKNFEYASKAIAKQEEKREKEEANSKTQETDPEEQDAKSEEQDAKSEKQQAKQEEKSEM